MKNQGTAPSDERPGHDTRLAIEQLSANGWSEALAGLSSLPPAKMAPARGLRRTKPAIIALALILTAAGSSALTAAIIEARSTVVVRFTLSAPDAASVGIAADFNGWSPTALPMHRASDGSWRADIRLRRDRTYQYNFVVDGTAWIVDPRAPLRLDDGFGGVVSTLVL